MVQGAPRVIGRAAEEYAKAVLLHEEYDPAIIETEIWVEHVQRYEHFHTSRTISFQHLSQASRRLRLSPPRHRSHVSISRFWIGATIRSHAGIYTTLDSTRQAGKYVKFTQQYSPELHIFCANRGFAPKLLGFERLIGGWFALAMEKIDIVDPWKIKPFSELDRWKKGIRELVEDFYQEDSVHGDLRLANFIFTRARPYRMLLIDFD